MREYKSTNVSPSSSFTFLHELSTKETEIISRVQESRGN